MFAERRLLLKGEGPWRSCRLACAPGVEGHACPGVSGPLCRSRQGEHAARKAQAQASKQAKPR